MEWLSLEKVNGNGQNEMMDPGNLLLIFMAAIYPLLVIPGPLDWFRGPRYILLAVVSLIAFYLLLKERIRLDRPAYIPLAFFLFFALVSTLLADNITMAWMGSNWRFTGFSTYLFCVVLFLIASKHKKPKQILSLLVTCAVAVAILGLLQYLGFNFIPHDSYSRDVVRAYSTMGNTNWFGTYTVFILPASILFYLFYKQTRWLAASAVIYAGLLASLTRGVWLAFFVALLVIAAYCYRKKRLEKQFVFLILVLVVVTLLLVPVNDWQIFRTAFSIPGEVSSAAGGESGAGSGRMHIWKEAVRSIPETWAFGMGADHFRVTMPSGKSMDKVHNIYLEMAVTMGVFALISFVGFISFFLRRWKNELGFLFFAMVSTYLVQGLFNNDIVQVMPLFWIVLGLSIANKELTIAARNDQDKNTGENVNKTNVIFTKYKLGPFAKFILGALIVVFVLTFSYWFFFPSQGTIETPGGGTYTGELRGSNFHGEGTWESGYGVTYSGEFQYGYFQGKGEMTFPNGTRYLGEFEKNQMHGEGKMLFPDGTVKEGVWHRGEFQGEGKNDG